MGNTLVVVISHDLRSEAFNFGAPPLSVAAWNMVFNLHTQEVAVIALDDPAVLRRNILVAFRESSCVPAASAKLTAPVCSLPAGGPDRRAELQLGARRVCYLSGL